MIHKISTLYDNKVKDAIIAKKDYESKIKLN